MFRFEGPNEVIAFDRELNNKEVVITNKYEGKELRCSPP